MENNNERITKPFYYLDIAGTVASRSTCLRRNYGAVIVKNDEIISTGYNGAVRGASNCIDINTCERKRLNIPSGSNYELCVSIHAEANAIISAARRDMIGSTLYLIGFDHKTGKILDQSLPCKMCRRMIVNAGIDRVICGTNNETNGLQFRTYSNIQDNPNMFLSID